MVFSKMDQELENRTSSEELFVIELEFDIKDKPEKDQKVDMESLQEENKQLKLKLKESSTKVENLGALVEKYMKDMAQWDDYINKLKKEIEDLKEELKKARENGSSPDDSSNSPPLCKK